MSRPFELSLAHMFRVSAHPGMVAHWQKAMSYLEPGSAMHQELAQLLHMGQEDQDGSEDQAEPLGLGPFRQLHAFDDDEGDEVHYSTLHGKSIEKRMQENGKIAEKASPSADANHTSASSGTSSDKPSIFELAGRAADDALAASSRRREAQGLGLANLDEEFGEIMAGNLFIDQIKMPDEEFDGSLSNTTLGSNVARQDKVAKKETSKSKQTMDFTTFLTDMELEEKTTDASSLSVSSSTTKRSGATARRPKVKIVHAQDADPEATGTFGVGEATCTPADFLNGTYDEEANAQSFQEALAAWRNGE